MQLKPMTVASEKIIEAVSSSHCCGIRVGETHDFTDIWVVVAKGRLFCRQYSFSKNSWASALKNGSNAYLHVDGEVFKIRGCIPVDIDDILPAVNHAYIEKYVDRLNYFPEIAKEAAHLEKHQRSTIELILIDSP